MVVDMYRLVWDVPGQPAWFRRALWYMQLGVFIISQLAFIVGTEILER
jgi:hypothetical protein